jgi:hypothetical protein
VVVEIEKELGNWMTRVFGAISVTRRQEKRYVFNTDNLWVYLESVIKNLLLVTATFFDAEEKLGIRKENYEIISLMSGIVKYGKFVM